MADAAMYLAKRRGRNRALCVDGVAEQGEEGPVDLADAEHRGDVHVVDVPGPPGRVPLPA